MNRKPNTVALGVYTIESLPLGEFVRKAKPCKACKGTGNQESGECVRCNGLKYEGGNKVYLRNAYDSSIKRYELDDTQDISGRAYLKKGALVIAGFTY